MGSVPCTPMVRALIPTVFSLALCCVAAAQEAGPKGPPPTPVKVAEARAADLSPRKKVFGELRASSRSTVAAEEGGIVREMRVAEGVRVAKGQTIARLDGARLDLELKVLEANAAVARATLAERELGRVRAERDLELIRRASAQGGSNPREIADAESDLAMAAAQVAQAKAAIAVVEEQGALLAKRRSDLEVVAPFAGVVTKKHAETGAWIAAGGAVVELLDDAHLEAWFDVPQEFLDAAERLAAEVAPEAASAGAAGAIGRAVRALEIRTATGATVEPKSVRVLPEIDEGTRTFHAIVGVARGSGSLAAGLSLHAFIPQGPPAQWTLVPKDAIVYQGVNASVFVVRGGIAVPTPVRAAFPLGDEVALDPGAVAAGDQVVVEGNERLIPGAAVAPVARGAGAAAAPARSSEVAR